MLEEVALVFGYGDAAAVALDQRRSAPALVAVVVGVKDPVHRTRAVRSQVLRGDVRPLPASISSAIAGRRAPT